MVTRIPPLSLFSGSIKFITTKMIEENGLCFEGNIFLLAITTASVILFEKCLNYVWELPQYLRALPDFVVFLSNKTL